MQTMRKLVAVKIEFEVFGKERVAYTETVDLEHIETTVKLINSTAHVRCVKTDLITKEEFDKNNLELIAQAHQRYINEYKSPVNEH